jgi:hypothetical protein
VRLAYELVDEVGGNSGRTFHGEVSCLLLESGKRH